MPIYEYKREDGTIFDVFQKISEPPLTTDPETGQAVSRVFSPVAVHFKGSGFYSTDYGKRGRSAAKDGEGSDKDTAKSGSASEGSGEASSSSSSSDSSSGGSASGDSSSSSASNGSSGSKAASEAS